MAEKSAMTEIDSLCMACSDASCDFKPVPMKRRALGPKDILIEMKYCGVCHSDLHHAADHNAATGKTSYPCVPGHELAGVCVAVGDACTKVKVGMHVGVGCMVDSCLECDKCKQGEEQLCNKQVGTYGSKDKNGRAFSPCGWTLGGYTSTFVVHEHFAIVIPESYPLEKAGPVMCAGITMYDPLVKLDAKAGKKVGIVGLGGLGLMGIKLAKAMGSSVTGISRSPAKENLARGAGADAYIATSVQEQVTASLGTFDIIINTIPVYHDYDVYTTMLKPTGKQVILGLHKGIVAGYVCGKLTGGKCRIMHSGIGGIKNTQAVIDLCAEKQIYPETQVMPCEKLNEIYGLLDGANDAGVRYVLDIANTLNDGTAEKCVDKPPTLSTPTGTMSYAGGILEAARLLVLRKT